MTKLCPDPDVYRVVGSDELFGAPQAGNSLFVVVDKDAMVRVETTHFSWRYFDENVPAIRREQDESLPGWVFSAHPTESGGYWIVGRHNDQRTVTQFSREPEDGIRWARKEAARIEALIRRVQNWK